MLKIVGFGSGSKENMTLEAVRAIQDSELVVGFRTYVELLKQYFPIHTNNAWIVLGKP